jgi:hypothetical protein
MLAEKNGAILTAHCSCMAGRGETCSHIGATIYMMEFHTKNKESLSCIDVASGWLPPTMSDVAVSRIKDLDFVSAKARMKRLEAMVDGKIITPLIKHLICKSFQFCNGSVFYCRESADNVSRKETEEALFINHDM